jgi:hypothetical protein
MQKLLNRIALVSAVIPLAAATLAAGESAQQAFVARWQGQRVVVKRTLYTLVYNERGRLGNVRNGRRDGLTVVTPSNGVYYQFDGRQGRSDVLQRQPQRMIDLVSEAYQPDALELRSYRKVEPVVMNRYDPGSELVVTRVRVERDAVRVEFAQAAPPAAVDEPATSITVKWPVPFGKAFSEQDIVEALIREFVDPKPLT